MAISDHIDRVQRRFRVLGFPIAVVYKFGDDIGNYLAALLTYYAFVSTLPLLLLASTVLSVILLGHPTLQDRLLDSALASFPVVGRQLKVPHALSGGTGGVVVGIAVATYGALGVAQALQYAANTVWAVPRNRRPNPILARGRSLVLVVIGGLGMLIAVSLSLTLHTVIGSDTLALSMLGFVSSVAIFAGVLMVVLRMSTPTRMRWRVLVPGSVFAAFLLELLQNFGYTYVSTVIRHASDLNAVFAIVLGMLAYLYLAALIVVFAMEINAVLALRLWPRALLTPFTDDVDLTRADERAYSRYARAQRFKGYEEIEVSFGERSPSARTPGSPGVSEGPQRSASAASPAVSDTTDQQAAAHAPAPPSPVPPSDKPSSNPSANSSGERAPTTRSTHVADRSEDQ